MKLNAWFGTSVAVVGICAAGLIAQTPTESQTSSSPITVVGCLQHAGDQAGTAGTTGSTAGAATGTSGSTGFILTNAKSGSESSSTAGAAATGTSGSGSTYTLDGAASELSSHVNQQVEITGTLASSSTDTGTSSASSGQKLKVSAVKMIASSCP
jgi:hypothetical protein